MITRLGIIFDIVFDLFTLCIPKTDDVSDFASINEGHVVERVAFGDKPDHAEFVVLISAIEPDKRLVPHQLSGKSEGQAVLSAVQLVFGWVEVDEHGLV